MGVVAALCEIAKGDEVKGWCFVYAVAGFLGRGDVVAAAVIRVRGETQHAVDLEVFRYTLSVVIYLLCSLSTSCGWSR